METVMDQIIDDHYRYRLFFYQTILISEGEINYSKVERLLNIKKQKINELIKYLNCDFREIGLSIQIKVKNREAISINKFSQLDYQMLRMYYFKKSRITDLLINVGFLQYYTIQEFADKIYFSKSKMYNLSHELNLILQNWGIKLTSSGLKGEEQKVRSFCFQLFYYFYSSDLENLPDFLTENNQSINRLINDLQLVHSVTFTINQRTQLSLFLQIQLFRMSTGGVIDIKNWEFVIDVPYSKILFNFFDSKKGYKSQQHTKF